MNAVLLRRKQNNGTELRRLEAPSAHCIAAKHEFPCLPHVESVHLARVVGVEAQNAPCRVFPGCWPAALVPATDLACPCRYLCIQNNRLGQLSRHDNESGLCAETASRCKAHRGSPATSQTSAASRPLPGTSRSISTMRQPAVGSWPSISSVSVSPPIRLAIALFPALHGPTSTIFVLSGALMAGSVAELADAAAMATHSINRCVLGLAFVLCLSVSLPRPHTDSIALRRSHHGRCDRRAAPSRIAAVLLRERLWPLRALRRFGCQQRPVRRNGPKAHPASWFGTMLGISAISRRQRVACTCWSRG